MDNRPQWELSQGFCDIRRLAVVPRRSEHLALNPNLLPDFMMCQALGPAVRVLGLAEASRRNAHPVPALHSSFLQGTTVYWYIAKL
jgi:hypothetical protein